jgi:predicted RNA binding protein YcfA (HicA-like mRNA interferase family)
MRKSYSSLEVIRMLQENGWYLVRATGDHHQFKHPEMP